MSRERDERVFANTLTELAFLLFFLLLLAALSNLHLLASERQEQSERRQAVETERAALAERASGLEAENAALRETAERLRDYEALVRRRGEALDPASTEDFLHLAAAQGRAQRLEEEAAGLRSQLAETSGALEQARRQVERLSGADDACAPVREDLARAEAARAELEQTRAQLAAHNAHLEYRLGRGGMDYPPCWTAAQGPARGRVEYLFDVTIDDASIAVAPGWPAHREAEARRLPGVEALLAGPMPAERFVEAAAPVFRWSVEHEPQCRHYVRIEDRSHGKEGYKRHMLAVESYFYKYEPRGQ